MFILNISASTRNLEVFKVMCRQKYDIFSIFFLPQLFTQNEFYQNLSNKHTLQLENTHGLIVFQNSACFLKLSNHLKLFFKLTQI